MFEGLFGRMDQAHKDASKYRLLLRLVQILADSQFETPYASQLYEILKEFDKADNVGDVNSRKFTVDMFNLDGIRISEADLRGRKNGNR